MFFFANKTIYTHNDITKQNDFSSLIIPTIYNKEQKNMVKNSGAWKEMIKDKCSICSIDT